MQKFIYSLLLIINKYLDFALIFMDLNMPIMDGI